MESNRQVAIHMNYKNEPRKLLPAAELLKIRRRPQSSIQINRRGSGNGPAGSA
jgi:hypothetical protein